MTLQFDMPIRTVSIDNLKAMCARVSGICHTYKIVRESKHNVYVEYSNPDEWGTPHPMTAVFPLVNLEGVNHVFLTYRHIMHDYPDLQGWQNFEILITCPELYRHKIQEREVWATRAEIEAGC
jgi:hypothetical protein